MQEPLLPAERARAGPAEREPGVCVGGGAVAIPPRSPSELSPGLQAALLSHERSRSPLPALGQRQGSQWKREALSTKQICWSCCSPSIPPSFIKLGPPANIFSPPANEHEVFPSLRLEGPLAAGSGELSAWAGRGAAPGGCRVGRGNPPTCSHREKDPSLSLEQPFRIATCQQPQR